MKKIVLLVLLSTSLSSYCQILDTIPWAKGRGLTWKDFRAKPKVGSNAAAVTASGITYSFSSLARGSEVEVEFKVNTFFYPDKSWYKKEVCDDIILSHEQLHFDISELFARKFKKRLNELTFTLKIKEEVRTIYKDILKELSDFQELYDWETNFSRDTEKQLEWNKKVAELLE
ncbi:hypothetical protein GGR42_000984 [Saonia flava]|uniref:DUF922 domain-containing protein n=1 Tax=Saonia flava TaxID=523696 RepID=A0A846QVC3_9FLAO|nr:hypothetical protein [Saonia flava]